MSEPVTDREFLAYLAGIIDGEGYIGIAVYRQKSRTGAVCPEYYAPVVSVGMSTKQPIFEIKRRIPQFGKICVMHPKRHHASWNKLTMYRVAATGKKALAILRMIEPFLILKRQKALKALELEAVTTPDGVKNYATYAERDANREVRTRIYREWLAMKDALD